MYSAPVAWYISVTLMNERWINIILTNNTIRGHLVNKNLYVVGFQWLVYSYKSKNAKVENKTGDMKIDKNKVKM